MLVDRKLVEAPSNFIAGRPKAILPFWFFGDFRYGMSLFIVIRVIYVGGRVVRWSWVNFMCQGVLLIWMIVGQEPIALAVGVGGGGLDIYTLLCLFTTLSPSLWETARYRLKYCLKGPLNPKQSNPIVLYINIEIGKKRCKMLD